MTELHERPDEASESAPSSEGGPAVESAATDAASVAASSPPPEQGSAASEIDESGESFDEVQAINAEPRGAAGDVRAVTQWRPEDAANFLAKAIQEAQRPYAEAMKRPTVPTGTVVLGMVIGGLFMVGLFFLLYQSEGRLEQALGRVDAVWQEQSKATQGQAVVQEELLRTQKDLALQKARQEVVLAEAKQAMSREKALDAQLEDALDQIQRLSRELEDQGTLRVRLVEAEKMARGALAEASKARRTTHLLQEQLDAQAEAKAALQRQLDAAQRLIRALQGLDEEGGEALEERPAEVIVEPAPPAEEAPVTEEAPPPAPPAERVPAPETLPVPAMPGDPAPPQPPAPPETESEEKDPVVPGEKGLL